MIIPKKVKKAAAWYIRRGWSPKFLGKEGAKSYYYIDFKGATVGFPVVLCAEGKEIIEFEGLTAVGLLSRFLEN